MTEPVHLQPCAELAARVLAPGDPGRALTLAQQLLEHPKMFNHNRGLWGYSGRAADGELLTIQSTGMGGPSAAIVISELADLGARRIIRVGTCGALDPALALGELLVVTEALAADGTSRALGAGARVGPDRELTAALLGTGGARAAVVVSSDLFYDSPEAQAREWLEAGAAAVEMECATLFTLARRRGVRAGAALIVSDTLSAQRTRIGPEELRAAERRLGELAARSVVS